jgi:hypothetical protein
MDSDADLRDDLRAMHDAASDSHACRLFSGFFMREDGHRFDYMIECRAIHRGVVWFSCVRHKGEYRGSPNGLLTDFHVNRAALEATVRGQVHEAIRSGLDVHVASARRRRDGS